MSRRTMCEKEITFMEMKAMDEIDESQAELGYVVKKPKHIINRYNFQLNECSF